jgi:hypothetical protein
MIFKFRSSHPITTLKGPWFIGEILENHLGVSFFWGTIVIYEYLQADVQYFIATLHVSKLERK